MNDYVYILIAFLFLALGPASSWACDGPFCSAPGVPRDEALTGIDRLIKSGNLELVNEWRKLDTRNTELQPAIDKGKDPKATPQQKTAANAAQAEKDENDKKKKGLEEQVGKNGGIGEKALAGANTLKQGDGGGGGMPFVPPPGGGSKDSGGNNSNNGGNNPSTTPATADAGKKEEESAALKEAAKVPEKSEVIADLGTEMNRGITASAKPSAEVDAQVARYKAEAEAAKAKAEQVAVAAKEVAPPAQVATRRRTAETPATETNRGNSGNPISLNGGNPIELAEAASARQGSVKAVARQPVTENRPVPMEPKIAAAPPASGTPVRGVTKVAAGTGASALLASAVSEEALEGPIASVKKPVGRGVRAPVSASAKAISRSVASVSPSQYKEMSTPRGVAGVMQSRAIPVGGSTPSLHASTRPPSNAPAARPAIAGERHRVGGSLIIQAGHR